MRSACPIAAVAALALACGPQAAPIKSTTTSYKDAEHAPKAQDRSVTGATGETPLGKLDDDKERLVYLRAGSVFVLTPAAGPAEEPFRLTAHASGARDESPAMSPHGDAVAFASARDGKSRIYVVPLGGGDPRPVTDGAGGGDFAPAWAPDGRKLVFARGRDRRDLYLLDFDAGGAPRLLLEGKDVEPLFAGAPAWSPDGNWIVFASDRAEGEGTGLWLIAPDGRGLRRLTRPEKPTAWARDLRPAWSPDGATIVFASNRGVASGDHAADLDIYAVDVASARVTRLTHDDGTADDPCFSPDGKRIYFSSTRDATRDYAIELYAMPAGGGQQLRLTRDEIPQNAAPSAGRVP